MAKGHPAANANLCVILEHLILFYLSVATPELKQYLENGVINRVPPELPLGLAVFPAAFVRFLAFVHRQLRNFPR